MAVNRRVPSIVRRPWRLGDVATATALALAVLAVHPVTYMRRAPYFVDELWVALSTRVPVARLPDVTCVTPIGFTYLIRLVPGSGELRYRMIVLGFAAAAVVLGYLLGLELRLVGPRTRPRLPARMTERLARRVTAVAIAAGVLLAPMYSRVMILKPYAGDTAVTLLLLLLLARLESQWSRRRLVAVAVVGALGMLLSHPSVFVTAAVFGSLLVVTLVRRAWRRLAEVAVAAAGCAAGTAVVFLLFVERHQNPSLAKWWTRYFIPTDEGVSGVLHFLDRRSARIAPFLGTRHLLVIAVLVAVGTATLLASRRPALAVATPLLVLVAMAASAARKYPFLDLRTSLFWLVAVLVVMAVAVAQLVALLARVHVLVGAVALVAVAALWLNQTSPYLGLHLIPPEPLGTQVKYLNAHRGANDVVVVSFSAAWGFAFYERWTPFSVVRLHDPPVGAPDFLPRFTRDPAIVVARGFGAADVRAAIGRATRRMRRQGAARLWIVLAHTEKREERVWAAALERDGIRFRAQAPGPWRADAPA
jgi:hypothetical protein